MVSKATVEMHPQEQVMGSVMEKPQAKEQVSVWVSLADWETDQSQAGAWGRAPDWDLELGADRAQVLELSLAQWPVLSGEELQEQGQERCQEPERALSALEEEQLADQEPQQVQPEGP